MLDYTKSFIETQFPVARVSKESYKERMGAQSQTLTGLGKWWGRKPLVLVRAAVLGALLPVSDNPKKDKEIFLKLMTMDDNGLRLRAQKLPAKFICQVMPEEKRELFFTYEVDDEDVVTKARWLKGVTKEKRQELMLTAFDNLPDYDAKLANCVRPEHVELTDEAEWAVINEHLETNAHNLQELIRELGQKRFGHTPVVGDCFAGGGSNVFEPARMGCDVYASDLNPVAALLTWGDLNLLNAFDDEGNSKAEVFIKKCVDKLGDFYEELGTEKRNNGWKVKYFLYCLEVTCPECGARVPLLPRFVVGQRTAHAYVSLTYNEEKNNFDITVHQNEDEKAYQKAIKTGIVDGDKFICPNPHCHNHKDNIPTSLTTLKQLHLQEWGAKKYMEDVDDLFHERLYALLCEDNKGKMQYVTVEEEDLEREKKIADYLAKHFDEWQEKGYIPSAEIIDGDETTRLSREQGWHYWHQLFNCRQLVLAGKLCQVIIENAINSVDFVTGIACINRLVNWNSKLAGWNAPRDDMSQTFYNQALNTLNNYATKGFATIPVLLKNKIKYVHCDIAKNCVELESANKVNNVADIWITDPPYADAVNYHELTEFFLAWDASLIKKTFPKWYTDSKRALAIKGKGKDFNLSMIEAYKNLAMLMPKNGLQIVMFTHKDTHVWADLAMILWSAGLQVTSAWCIVTEKEAVGFKQGNYVSGTVLMVLRRRQGDETAFKDELFEEIREEVQVQIDSMRGIDEGTGADFNDADYHLAAYVAALKVLTSYKDIEGIDVEQELRRSQDDGETGEIADIIRKAEDEAQSYLVPREIPSHIWRNLTDSERFYIKGLELELNGVHKMGAFQETARALAVTDYQDMLASTAANKARLKTAMDYRNTMTEKGFGTTPLRQVLLAVYVATKANNALEGRNYLRSFYQEGNRYWTLKEQLVVLLSFLSLTKDNANTSYWQEPAEYAAMLCEAVQNDSL